MDAVVLCIMLHLLLLSPFLEADEDPKILLFGLSVARQFLHHPRHDASVQNVAVIQ
jgi:hypothetical protein